MAFKSKYTQEICKLSQSTTRLKEQVAGHLLLLMPDTNRMPGIPAQYSSCAEPSTAQLHSVLPVGHITQKPLLGQVTALENVMTKLPSTRSKISSCPTSVARKFVHEESSLLVKFACGLHKPRRVRRGPRTPSGRAAKKLGCHHLPQHQTVRNRFRCA